MQIQQQYAQVGDAAIAVAAVTSPWWATIENGLTLYMILGGAVLLTFRILIAWRTWKCERRKDPEVSKRQREWYTKKGGSDA